MGWWGHYVGICPKGAERIKAILHEVGIENNRAEDAGTVWEVLGSALKGTTLYTAVRITDKATGESYVAADVLLSNFSKDGYLMVKHMTENMGPYQYDCPAYILNKLTPTENEYALEWREKCRKKLEAEKNLGKLPQGTRIRVNKEGSPIVEVTTYRGRRAYIDWLHSVRYLPKYLIRYGYEVMTTPKGAK